MVGGSNRPNLRLLEFRFGIADKTVNSPGFSKWRLYPFPQFSISALKSTDYVQKFLQQN
jgi:hypothetical protein